MLGDMSHLKLGMLFNVMSPVVNLSQTAINTYPVLGARLTGIGIKRFNKAVLSAIRKEPNADWRQLERIGVGSLPTFAEGSEHEFEKEGVLSKVSMSLFTGMETFNRGVAYLGALTEAQEKGWSPAKQREYAHSVMKRTQLNYEGPAKPEILRHTLWRVPLQFKNFMVQQLAFVVGLRGQRKHGYASPELARFMTAMTLSAGLLGSPIVALFDMLTRMVTELLYGKEWSPMLAMKESAIDAAGSGELSGDIMTFVTRGAPGLAGFDMVGRVGMGDKFLPDDFRDLQGPWLSTMIECRAPRSVRGQYQRPASQPEPRCRQPDQDAGVLHERECCQQPVEGKSPRVHRDEHRVSD